MNIFGGMHILWIFFGCHYKIGLYLGVISWVKNFEFQYFGVFFSEKMNIWGGGDKDFAYFGGGGASQNRTTFRGSLCILGPFLKVKVQNGGYILGLLKFQIFFLGA